MNERAEKSAWYENFSHSLYAIIVFADVESYTRIAARSTRIRYRRRPNDFERSGHLRDITRREQPARTEHGAKFDERQASVLMQKCRCSAWSRPVHEDEMHGVRMKYLRPRGEFSGMVPA